MFLFHEIRISDVTTHFARAGRVAGNHHWLMPAVLDWAGYVGAEPMTKPESFQIDKIYVPVKRRKTLKSELVQEIAESILEIGQQTPIHIRPDEDRFVLVEGLHRLEACKALGEKTIIGLLVSAAIAHQKVLSSLDAEAEVERQKMARLRKLRLEKEAAEKSAAAAGQATEILPAAVPCESPERQARGKLNATSRRSSRKTSELEPKTLSEWFLKQEREGFRY